MKSSKRFTSEKTANNFSNKVNGKVSDLRDHEDRKSDFKVIYEKSNDRNRFQDERGYDFDSDLNMNGTNWGNYIRVRPAKKGGLL